jgi:spore maturation protein CgeB
LALQRVLYAGALTHFKYNTTICRLRALRALGLDVVSLDAAQALGRNLWVRRVNQRTYLGPSVRAMNSALLAAAKSQRPDVVWLDTALWVYPWTLRRLRAYTRFLVHYNTDDVFYAPTFYWLHRLGVSQSDLYLSTNRLNVLELRQRYGVRTLRVGMGYDADLHRPLENAPPSSPIVFVGHWERSTERFLQSLLDAGLPLRAWGNRWEHSSSDALRSVAFLAEDDYVPTIAGADIALCILSRANRNESTGRSFEIPGIGTFMLAERTPEHVFIYGDGAGAGLFSGTEELVSKVQYFLGRPAEREEIARTGHARCAEMGLSWQAHVRREWPILERLLLRQSDATTPDDDAPFWQGFRRGQPYAPASGAACPSKGRSVRR